MLLAFFLVLITIQAYMHQVNGGGISPSIHALCPYGGLESLYSVIFSGTFIQKIFIGTMTLLLITLLLSIFFRRSFCGLICPFGALQEFFGLLGKKLFKRRFIIPPVIDKPLRYLKYIILLITIIFAWKTAGLWMDPYDPWAAYGHLTGEFSSLTSEYIIALIILIIVAIGSILYDRFFCKYLCPMGAVYGIISKLSPSNIIRNNDKCISCGLCSKNCPVNIDVAHLSEITSAECLSCQSCVLSCPQKDALEYKTLGKSIKPFATIIIVVVIFFGGLFISKSVGLFGVLPEPVKAGTTLNTEEIKGYMTLKNVSTGTGIELKNLYQTLGIPDSVSADTKLKDIKNFVNGFEVEAAKEKLKGR